MTQLNQKQEKNPDTSGLIRKSDYNKRLQKKKVKYLVLVSGLASTSAFTVVENKIPNVRSLVKKKKQIITQRLVKLKRNLLIMIMINILIPQNLIIQQQGFLLQNKHKPIQ